MLNIALFISGRIIGYKDCLIPILNTLKNNYNIYLFLSINSEIDQEVIELLQPVKYQFKKFFYEQDWIDNRVKHNCNFLGGYKQLSMFFNDHNNYLMIDEYENENNISFDIICKLRPDMTFQDINQVEFIKDEEDCLILRDTVPESPIQWGGISPSFICDAFCYGNKKSMKIYCDTYNWIKKIDIELNGQYDLRTFESYLNENIFGFLFGDPRTNNYPVLSYEEYKSKMINNNNNIKYITHTWYYRLLPKNIRSSNDRNIPIHNIQLNNIMWKWNHKYEGLERVELISVKGKIDYLYPSL